MEVARSREHFIRLNIKPVFISAPREINSDRGRRRLNNGMRKNRVRDDHLTVNVEALVILGVLVEDGPDNGLAVALMLPEGGVPQGQVLVPSLEGLADARAHVFGVDVRLPPFGVNVRVRPVEWQPRSRLVPPGEEFGIGVLEEAPDVGAAEADAAQGQAQAHGVRDRQVGPLGGVVARPHGCVSLGPGEVAPR